MKLGVTGASGFLGSAVVAAAREKGWEVVAFSRNPGREIAGAGEVRRFPEGSGERLDLSGVDAVVHLAGESIFGLWTRAKRKRILESRVDSTRRVFETMEEMPPQERPSVLVSASGTGFYGDRGGEVLDEGSGVGFGFLAAVCRDWEREASAAGGIGSRVVLMRLGMVLGRGGALRVLRRIFRIGLGGRLGNGRQWMPWIHVEDAARACLACVENGDIRGAVNFVSPGAVTNREFAKTLGGALGRPAWAPAPGFVLSCLPGGMGEMFLFSQRVVPVALDAFGFEWKWGDLDAAVRNVSKQFDRSSEEPRDDTP